jgi:hypothetical protein
LIVRPGDGRGKFGRMSEAIGIYTICYRRGMAEQVDPAFRALEVGASPEPQRREIAHMLNFWRRGGPREQAVSGLLSPKFTGKAGLSGRQFVDFIAANPGHDVWFVNPYPHELYLAFNVWEQGEFWHPGLLERAAKLFRNAGLPVELDSVPRSRPETLLFCNYWAGTPEFWDRYMADIERMAAAADHVPELFDAASYAPPATFFPFVFERYFTTFLTRHPEIRVCAWRHAQEALFPSRVRLTEEVAVRAWAPLIDRWDREGVYDEDRRQVFRAIQRSLVVPEKKKPTVLRRLAREAARPFRQLGRAVSSPSR